MSRELILSGRMQSVADRVSSGVRLADVGCDHGYLSIWLCETGRIPSAVAMDVNKGPLERAGINVAAHHLQQRIQLRLSDGLEQLEPGEVDSVVIAGMGGMLICRILRARPDVVASLKELVLEPQSDTEQVRRCIKQCGFAVVDEDLVLEDGKYYPVIRAVPEDPDQTGNDCASVDEKRALAEARYGRILLEKKHPVLRKMLERDRKKTRELISQLSCSSTEKGLARAAELKEELQCMDTALSYYEM